MQRTLSVRRAFTLIELVAVILVLAILGGIAIPRYINNAQRAKDSADEGALAGMSTALNSTYMSNRSTDADSSKWITTIAAIAPAMETKALPQGWTVDSNQLIDLRGNRYDFIPETAQSAARIVSTTAGSPGGSGGGSGGSGGSGVAARTASEVQAMTTAQVLASNLTPAEFALLTPEQLAALSPAELAAFSDQHIAALTASQLTGLTYAQVESISPRVTATQIPLLRPDQLAMLSATAYAALTPAQRAAMTTAQVAERAISEDARARSFDGIRTLNVAAIKYLLPTQIAAINSDYQMGLLSADRRAALTQDQVQAINARNVSLAYLTDAQRLQLTAAQFGVIRTDDVRYVPVARLNDVPAGTIGAINSDYAMGLISADRRAAFNTAQVQALNTAVVSLAYLTDAQRAQTTVAQLAAIRTDDVRYVPVSRLADVLPATIGAINSDYAMGLISADRRAAFNTAQVQALNTAVVSLAYLTDAQRAQTTAGQLAAIRTDDVRYVPVARLGDVPAGTIGAINSDYAMGLISEDRRAAFNTAQVQALNTAVVSLAYLTDAQRAQTTAGQLAAIRTDDVRYVPVSRLADVPAGTIGAINSDYAMGLISADRRAAFNTAQVQALNTAVVSLAYLTDTQREQATSAQLANIRTDDVRYVPVSRLADVPAGTIGNINSDYAMGLISADRRAAFNTAQVQALNTSVVSLAYLTDAQRAQTTSAQLANIRTDDVRYVPPTRMGDVTTAAVGGINSDYAMGLVSADRRAAFNTAQVQAINTAVVSLAYLTDAQREQTTSAQLAAIRTSDVQHAPASRMGEIPTATIAAISSDYDWGLVSTPRVQALTQAQILAIPAARYNVLRSRLTAQQQAWR